MPSPTLAAGVYARDPVTADAVYYAPGSTPPDWAQRLILNPAAWTGGVAPYPSPGAEPPADITELLKEWTSGEAYEATAVTRNANGVITSATVLWPDGSAGTFTATTVNGTWNTVDAFTITHTLSGKTVTQSAVTRDGNGLVTAKPALVVS